MGYWISHSIRITGNEQDIKTFMSNLSQRRPKELNDEGDIVWSEEEFSFYNIISPPEEMIMDGSWWGDAGNEWRTQNWECYDAPAEDFHSSLGYSGKWTAYISMSTKYDWPNNVFHKLVEQYPNLEFSIWSEGEECEAIEIEGRNGVWDETHYDAPNSHADWVARDSVDNCWCANYDDPGDWYEDCPKEDYFEVYEVVAITRHLVKAYTTEKAIEALKAFEDGFDMPSNTLMVKYDNANTYTALPVKEVKENE